MPERQRLPELVVEAGAHDVVAFLDCARQRAVEGPVADDVAAAAEIDVQVLRLDAPEWSKLPLETGADRPACRGVGRSEYYRARGDADRASERRPDLGFAISETTGRVCQQGGRPEPAEPSTDGTKGVEPTREGGGERWERRRSRRSENRGGAVLADSVVVGLDPRDPERRELPIVADLTAANEPIVAHADRTGNKAGGQRRAETARAGIGRGIGECTVRRADPT